MKRKFEAAGKAASVRKSSGALYNCPVATKNALLDRIIYHLESESPAILQANRKDLRNAEESGLSKVLIERLTLTEKRIRQMITGLQDVIKLPDPVGKIVSTVTRPGGMLVSRVRVPLGAIGIIYESRPNVTIDAAALCLKAGNAVLLRGGSEAVNSNRKLVDVLKKALKEVGLPAGCVEFIGSTDRREVLAMIKEEKNLDVIIPRGSQKMISTIRANATVPVIAHGDGNCHVYVDDSADTAMAERITVNAKVQRPSVCNAAEKLLVHEKIAQTFLPPVINALRTHGVEIRGDRKTKSIVKNVKPAKETDWSTEYLDLIMAVKVVKDIDEAIRHINHYGSHHSDAIVTGSNENGDRFLRDVDSAAVYVNASTRFTDGSEFGLGAEIGISTQKLHARGPMGLEELTCTKYVIHGTGHIRS